MRRFSMGSPCSHPSPRPCRLEAAATPLLDLQSDPAIRGHRSPRAGLSLSANIHRGVRNNSSCDRVCLRARSAEICT
jgi:hypothetical protein